MFSNLIKIVFVNSIHFTKIFLFSRLPPPPQFGQGNPFLMFLCIACLLEHRDYIMRSQLDYQDIAMYFDKLVRGHDVDRWDGG